MRFSLRVALLACGVLLLEAAPLTAQSTAQRLLTQARAQFENLDGDSAYKLAATALQANPTPREKVRAYVLLGIGELMKAQPSRVAARDAFVEALKLEPNERVDSLKDHASDVLIVFAEAVPRAQAELAAMTLNVTVLLSPDTTVNVGDARYVFFVESNLRSTVVSRIVQADAPNALVWSDSQPTHARRTVAWPLRGSNGIMLPSGRYLLRSQAFDASGRASAVYERTIRLTRAVPDTQRHPTPLPASAFAPETLQVAKARMPRLLISGVSIAALVAITPTALGNSTLNAGLSGDPTSYAVAGGVALASVVGFIKARTPAKLSLENIEKNRLLRENDQRQRDGILQNNARAREQAPMRVTVESGGAP
jgi:hypothetical protein